MSLRTKSERLPGPMDKKAETKLFGQANDHSTLSEVELYGPFAQEKRLVRKLDMRILPLICILYLFAYLDRTNIGNARLQGLPEDVLGGDPTGVLFDWINSVFFFSYILIQIPATIISKFFPPRIWIGCATLGWGLCSTLMAAGFNFPGLIIARIGVGAAEACFSPGVALYMSFFYTKHELGLRLACYFSFAAVAGAFGGLIAFGVQHIHSSIANWKLLFLIEGLPSLALGVVSLKLFLNRPEETTFFDENERALALLRMNRGISGDLGRTVNKKHIVAAFKDWRVYVAGIIYFGSNCSLAAITAFLPTIIKTLGFTNALAQLLTVPPYMVSAVVMCATSYCSDRLQNRGMLMAGASVVAGIGYLLMLTVPSNNHVRYFATFCITSGTYTTIGIIIAWFAHNLGSETKRATGGPLYMCIGQFGSILGSHIYPITEGPKYTRGFAVTCALVLIAAICSVVLSVSFSLENARRDRIYGKPIPDARVDVSELADQAPSFRYIP